MYSLFYAAELSGLWNLQAEVQNPSSLADTNLCECKGTKNFWHVQIIEGENEKFSSQRQDVMALWRQENRNYSFAHGTKRAALDAGTNDKEMHRRYPLNTKMKPHARIRCGRNWRRRMLHPAWCYIRIGRVTGRAASLAALSNMTPICQTGRGNNVRTQREDSDALICLCASPVEWRVVLKRREERNNRSNKVR